MKQSGLLELDERDRLLLVRLAPHVERGLTRERIVAALGAKKRRGEPLGRRRALTPSQLAEARTMLERGDSPSHVARILRVNRSTLYRALGRTSET